MQSSLGFNITIGAKDTTAGTMRAAARRFASFARSVSKPIRIPIRIARKGLALARDINVGLAPIVRGIDRIIERGTGMEVVRKSFESLTGKSGRQAAVMARQLTQAASGTLRLARAMQIANRAMGSGLSFQQLTVAMDFISKKAITTGKNAEQAIDSVITGLSCGSTLFLDDFGILVDGLESVKRGYNAIKGLGAWDSLGPAAQKAETIRQAIGEMRQQLGKIGVTGKETVFVFKSIKNAIGDATDKLFAAVGRSGALKDALVGVRDIIGGVTKHVESGGSLSDVLFGKKDKKGNRGGSLLGIAKAGVLDLGEVLGRGVLGGILKGLSKLPDLFNAAWGKLKGAWAWAVAKIPPAIEKGLGWLTTSFLPALKSTLIDTARAIGKMLRDVWSKLPTPGKLLDFFSSLGNIGESGDQSAYANWLRRRMAPETPGFGASFGLRRRPEDFTNYYMPTPKAILKDRGFFDSLGKAADRLFAGIWSGGERLRKATGRFAKDFPPPDDDGDDGDDGEYPYGLKKRRKLKRDIHGKKREIKLHDAVSERRLKMQAARETKEEIRRLRAAGLDVRRADRQGIFDEIYKRIKEEREEERERLFAELRRLEKLLEDSDRKARARRRGAGRGANWPSLLGRGAVARPGAGDFTEVYRGPGSGMGLGEEGPSSGAGRPQVSGSDVGRIVGEAAKTQAKAAEKTAQSVEKLEVIAANLAGLIDQGLQALAGADRRLATVGPKRA